MKSSIELSSYKSFWMFFLLTFLARVSVAQNIALNKSYTISDKPSYAATSKDPDLKVLTDGVYTNTYFWNSQTTVGWVKNSRVTVEIDLGKSMPIDKVTFNTARNNGASVYFPANIFVFTSVDQVNYKYSGDIMTSADNLDGPYEVKKFTLSNIGQSGRYVKLIIVAKGLLIFTDEIEVLSGASSRRNSNKLISKNNISNAVDSLLRLSNGNAKIKYEMSRFQSAGNSKSVTSASLEGLSQVKRDRLVRLNKKISKEVVVDIVSPWIRLLNPYEPQDNGSGGYKLTVPLNGVQYGSFVVSNLSKSSKTFKCIYQNDNSSDTNLGVLYNSPFVTSGAQYTDVADPLIENNSVVIGSGESRVYTFKVTGNKIGTANSKIYIKSDNYSSVLPIVTKVINQKLIPGGLSINADNWAYLNYPMINDRKQVAVDDLNEHHINTMVIPPIALPAIGSSDYRRYKDYISDLKSPKYILLMMNLKDSGVQKSFNGAAFLSAEWKAKFVDWYNGIISNSKLPNIARSKILVYPYDEVSGKDIASFVALLSWLKSEHPEIKTFATLSTPEAVRSLLPLVEIGQVLNIDNLIQIANKTTSGGEVWLYAADGSAELLSPYSYYRLMSWKAFYNDMKGVGFWAYADFHNGTNNVAHVADFDGVNGNNYSVVYSGPNKSLIPSKRWEAFRLGMEDYELLVRYAKLRGLSQTKALVSKVIAEPDNTALADMIRGQILQSLQ